MGAVCADRLVGSGMEMGCYGNSKWIRRDRTDLSDQ